MRPGRVLAAFATLTVALSAAAIVAGQADAFIESRDHPAINYSDGPERNPVANLNQRVRDGEVHLTFDPANGYLRSVLEALDIPLESQMLVYSQTSLQGKLLNPQNPRAIFFKDNIAVGWVRGGTLLELATHDLQQGTMFYTVAQAADEKPRFTRNEECLACHLSWDTLGVPGFLFVSTFPMADDKNAYAGGVVADHRTSMAQRWGGWYVTGSAGPVRHMGNVPVDRPQPATPPPELKTVDGLFDPTGYLSRHSDVAALMVFGHQAHMLNLITRLGWEARVAAYDQRAASATLVRPREAVERKDRVREAAAQLVDYLLFVDEAPLAGKIRGSSGFTEKFSGVGPRDSKGRSLRQLDLELRLMKYRCSYLIYSEAFDSLPASAKDAVYRRMWEILSGAEKGKPYIRFSQADRQAVVEILRDTKKDLPAYFR